MKLLAKRMVMLLTVITLIGLTTVSISAVETNNLSKDTLNSAVSGSSAVSLIGAVDENGEFLSMSTGVALSYENGGVGIYTTEGVYVENAYAYMWITDSDAYIAEYSGSIESLGMIEFVSEDGENDPSALYVATPYQGESSTIVYMDRNAEMGLANVVVQNMGYADDFALISIDGFPGVDMYFPAVIIDVDGNCTGVVMDSSVIWAPAMDEEFFYGDSDSSGTGGSGSGGSGTGGSGGSGGSGTGGSGSGGSFLDDIGSGALIGALAGIGVVVVAVIMKNSKKKNAGSPMNPQTPQQPISQPVQELIQPTGPVTPVYQEEPKSAASVGGFNLRAIGGYMDGRVYSINHQEITFGRDASCVVRFPADAKGVSRNHCKLFWKNGTLMLMDMNSSYGTYVEGGKLYPMQPVAIKFGDVFYIGEKNNQFKIQ